MASPLPVAYRFRFGDTVTGDAGIRERRTMTCGVTEGDAWRRPYSRIPIPIRRYGDRRRRDP